MPINPKEIPELFEKFRPYMEGLDGTPDDFEYFYNKIEELVKAGTPITAVEFPPEFVPLAQALYKEIQKRLAPPPKPAKPPTPVEPPVASLREALALLTVNAREKLKALLTKNPILQDRLKDIGEHLQRSGVTLIAKQPGGEAMGNLTPSAGISTEVERDKTR